MKAFIVAALAAVSTLAVVHADLADAARLGGGRSFGMQRSITPTPRTAPPAQSFSGPAQNPVMPATPGASASRAAAGAAASAPSRTSRWLGPLAGLAAGLGLAALFAHLGLSETLGSLLLIALLVAGVVVLVRAFAHRRGTSPPYPYAGGEPGAARASVEPWAVPGVEREPREPIDVEASARYPAGFDPAPFLAQAKQQFRRVQAAYDRGDRALLDNVTTAEMQAEIAHDLVTRGAHVATDVVSLDADLVEVVREGDRYVASVRFHGMLREDGAPTPQPFEELWHLAKPVDGSTGWLLAGIQQYA